MQLKHMHTNTFVYTHAGSRVHVQAHTCMREAEVLNLSFRTDINSGRSLEWNIFIDQFFCKIGDKYSSLQFHNFGDSSK